MDALQYRYSNTLNFIRKNAPEAKHVMDLGTPNAFSKIMQDNGYQVDNTQGEDLDFQFETLKSYQNIELVTALEICEHLLNPLQVLQNLPADRLVASVPLSLWFAKAYRSKTDKWDRHFHEFEDWQFDWLLEKAGWEIKDSMKWKSITKEIGIRPMLRRTTPRYYMVYAERK